MKEPLTYTYGSLVVALCATTGAPKGGCLGIIPLTFWVGAVRCHVLDPAPARCLANTYTEKGVPMAQIASCYKQHKSQRLLASPSREYRLSVSGCRARRTRRTADRARPQASRAPGRHEAHPKSAPRAFFFSQATISSWSSVSKDAGAVTLLRIGAVENTWLGSAPCRCSTCITQMLPL